MLSKNMFKYFNYQMFVYELRLYYAISLLDSKSMGLKIHKVALHNGIAFPI